MCKYMNATEMDRWFDSNRMEYIHGLLMHLNVIIFRINTRIMLFVVVIRHHGRLANFMRIIICLKLTFIYKRGGPAVLAPRRPWAAGPDTTTAPRDTNPGTDVSPGLQTPTPWQPLNSPHVMCYWQCSGNR